MDLYRMNLWQMLLAGGPMMWPILLCSIFTVAITIEKFLFLRKIKIDNREFLDNVLEKVKRHEIKEAIGACDSVKTPLSNIIKSGILKYDRTRPQIKEAIDDAALYEIPRLEKNLPVLATLAHVTPLLGFLGTVLGMIRCFQVMQAKATVYNPVSPADLASGVWESLISTVFGLIVAVFAFIAYNYLVGLVNAFILDMEKASTELVNFLTE